MTETTPSFGDKQQNRATKANGFIDYYELIHEEPDATITRLRSTINNLHNEAQANRDHRNLNKRRGYQEILTLLPQAREFLLDEDIRPQYDTYREDALSGTAKQSFEDWKAATLKKEGEVEGNAVLGVQEEQQRLRGQEVRAQVLKVSKDKQPKSRVTVDKGTDEAPAPRSSSLGAIASASIFFAVLIIARELFSAAPPIALLIAAILALIVWLGAYFANRGRTPV